MTLEAAIFAKLGPLVGGRAYPGTFPQDCVWPAIRFSFVGANLHPDICSDGGPGDDEDLSDPEVQVDGVDKTYDGMRALRLAIAGAMKTLDPPAYLSGVDFQDYEPDEKRHRSVMRYVVQPSSST